MALQPLGRIAAVDISHHYTDDTSDPEDHTDKVEDVDYFGGTRGIIVIHGGFRHMNLPDIVDIKSS